MDGGGPGIEVSEQVLGWYTCDQDGGDGGSLLMGLHNLHPGGQDIGARLETLDLFVHGPGGCLVGLPILRVHRSRRGLRGPFAESDMVGFGGAGAEGHRIGDGYALPLVYAEGCGAW